MGTRRTRVSPLMAPDKPTAQAGHAPAAPTSAPTPALAAAAVMTPARSLQTCAACDDATPCPTCAAGRAAARGILLRKPGPASFGRSSADAAPRLWRATAAEAGVPGPAAVRRASYFDRRLGPPDAIRLGEANHPHEAAADCVGEAAASRRGLASPAASKGNADGLEPDVRRPIEATLGRDLGHVRVFSDPPARAAAQALGAKAFAWKDGVWLGPGQSPRDVKLLGHEAAHVAQGDDGQVRRSLDAANTDAWDWYGNKEHRKDGYVETLDRAPRDAATVAKDLKDAPAPTTDDEREAADKQISTLVRLNAITMVAAHRKELLDRKARFEKMLAPAPPGTSGAGKTEAERKVETAKAIRTAARAVINLNAWKERLSDSQNNLASAVRINAGPEAISEEFANLQKYAQPEPPKDLAEKVQGTKAQMEGVSWGTKKVRMMELGNYLVSVRKKQISGTNGSLALVYDRFPFLADLSAEQIMTGHKHGKGARTAVASGVGSLLLPILGGFIGGAIALADPDKEMDDETLLAEVKASFERIIDNTDDAIAKIGSEGIHPLDLPGAVLATRGALSPAMQAELDRMKQDREVLNFTKDMVLVLGIAVLAGLTGGLAGVGLAGWAAASGAAAATLGAAQLAGQAKDLLNRQTLADAATNPEGELLGVSAPTVLEKVMFGVGVILAAVDLAGVAAEIRSLRVSSLQGEAHLPGGVHPEPHPGETPPEPGAPAAKPEPGAPIVPTAEEKELLDATGPKDSVKLTAAEANKERAIAAKAPAEPVNDPPFTVKRKLPNGHEVEETPEGDLFKRCSDHCVIRNADGEVIAEEELEEAAATPGAAQNVDPQTRHLAVSNPQLVADYEQLATQKLPGIVREVLDAERSTPGRTRLAQLKGEFDKLRAEVGNATDLTAAQRVRGDEILKEARKLARDDFGNLQTKVTKRLRADPDLKAIEDKLVAAGDAEAKATGGLRLKTQKASGETSFEPVNIEHRARLSDNPWTAKKPENLLVTDASQNQQYLEGLRQYGAVWPADEVEDFVIRHQLNSQGIDFRPGGD